MIFTKELEKARDRVLRRQKILINAVEQYDKLTTEILAEADVEIKSMPLKKVEIAELLEMHYSSVFRMGANECATYAQLWRWVRSEKPNLLRRVERNYEQLLKRRTA